MSPTQRLLRTTLQLLGYGDGATSDPSNAAACSSPSAQMVAMCWFLLQRLDPNKARERLGQCYPPATAVQHREFRQRVTSWFEELKRERRLAADLVVRRSYFDECRGERYDRAMLALAVCVMRQGVHGARSGNVRGIDGDAHAMDAHDMDALLRQLDSERAAFELHLRTRMAERNEWKRRADNIAARRRQCMELQQELDTWRRDRDREGHAATTLLSWDDITPAVQELSNEWKTLETYLSRDTFSLVDGAYARGDEDSSLDGRALVSAFSLPPRFARVWEQELQRASVTPIVDGDRLHLTSLVKLWQCVMAHHAVCINGAEGGGTNIDDGDTTDDQIMAKKTQQLLQGDLAAPSQLLHDPSVHNSIMQRFSDILGHVHEGKVGIADIRCKLDELPEMVDVELATSESSRTSTALPSIEPFSLPPLSFMTVEEDHNDPLVHPETLPTPMAVERVLTEISNTAVAVEQTPVPRVVRVPLTSATLEDTPAKSMPSISKHVVPIASSKPTPTVPSRPINVAKLKLGMQPKTPRAFSPKKPSKLFAVAHSTSDENRAPNVQPVDIVCDEIAQFILDDDAKSHEMWQAIDEPLGALGHTAFDRHQELTRTPPHAPETASTPFRKRLSYSAAIITKPAASVIAVATPLSSSVANLSSMSMMIGCEDVGEASMLMDMAADGGSFLLE